jgi:hypothetical protein
MNGLKVFLDIFLGGWSVGSILRQGWRAQG